MTYATETRFDLYSTIHKGLRAFMTDVLVSLGRTDFADDAQIEHVLNQTRALIDLCHDHLFHEDRYVHPAMEARRPGSACPTASQHTDHLAGFEALEGQIITVQRSQGAERAASLGKLYRSICLFVAENIVHMNIEEQENNAVLWAAYRDEELIAIHREILASIAPETMQTASRWMLPNISHAERTAVLSGMRRSLPPSAFRGILNLTRANLPDADWQKLADALQLEPVFV